MRPKQFGSSTLEVTPIGLGLAALGRPGYINLGHADDLNEKYEVAAMEAHAHDVLDAAWAAGIRYFDAARSYGRAEQFLASWLHARGLATDSVAVGSKWGYTYTAGWQVSAEQHEVKEHSLPVLKRQIAESRALLGDHLNLYQIHSATLDSGVLENREVLEKLAELRAGGLLIGLSLSGPEQPKTLCKAMEVQVAGERVFDAVQATWNLLEKSATPALEEAHQRGMGVIIKEALANGRLTSRNQEPDFAAKRSLLERTARRHETTIDALSLAAVLAQPWVDIVLSGAAAVEHIWSNLRALEVSWDLKTEHQLAALVEAPAEYWQKRSRLSWN